MQQFYFFSVFVYTSLLELFLWIHDVDIMHYASAHSVLQYNAPDSCIIPGNGLPGSKVEIAQSH